MSSTTILGLPPFKFALSFEILANIASLPALILYPSYGASFLLAPTIAGPSPSTLTLTRWFGGLVAGLTVPLIFSLPSPSTEQQVGFRRATYITMGAGEVALGSLMAYAYLQGEGESGFSSQAMLGGAVNMFTLLGMRVLFLVYKPEWIEESGKVKGQ